MPHFPVRHFRRCLAFALVVAALVPGGASLAVAGDTLDVRNLDRVEAPSDDFYRFAVGGWLARNPIPVDRAK